VPAPAIEWKEYEVPVDVRGEDLELRARAAPTATVTVAIPDLSAFPSPRAKAEFLLQSAAEVEHMLMVQYLYAVYSLKSEKEVTDAEQKRVLSETSPKAWPQVLLDIAREEMGHLMTVQNLLLLLGLKPNFEREDFPPHKDIYPFELHLEPLSQRSLAKYVVAEAATDAPGIDAIATIAKAKAGAPINRVGNLYGLLGLVFTAAGDVDGGATGDEAWDAIVRLMAAAAAQQNPSTEAWHLRDEDFHPQSLSQQADPEHWQVGHLRVHRAADRAAAVQAIRDIGEQGEGPTTAKEQSHFARFLAIFQKLGSFPAQPDQFVPTRDVPTDPKADAEHIPNERTRHWAELGDIRYALLLGFLEHYLLGDADERNLLTAWIFAEMRSRVGAIARKLTEMPRAEGADARVAAIPFKLPDDLHLPSGRNARWEVHRGRTEAAIAKVQAMRADPADGADPYLDGLLASDQARLALMAHPPPTGPIPTSAARDILPLFRPKDAEHMGRLSAARRVDLQHLKGERGVRAQAGPIHDRVSGKQDAGQPMPLPPGQRWTKVQTDLFKRWMDEGLPD
jgi:Ferritin-like